MVTTPIGKGWYEQDIEMARTKATMEIRSLARGYTAKCVQTLAGLMTNEQTPPSARVQAAMALLDRGWGKPVQGVTSEPDEPPVRVVVTYAEPTPDNRQSS